MTIGNFRSARLAQEAEGASSRLIKTHTFERSRNALAEAVSISPNLTVSKLLTWEYYRNPNDAERLRKLLIAAGLPE